MKTFEKDLEFGKTKEEELTEILKEFFDDNLKPVDKKNKYCKWDYEGDKYIYELKSRNNKLNDYPTTLIPYDKIIKGKKQYFIFNFMDKIGYIRYSKKKFKNFELKPFKRNFRGGYNDLEKLYYFIPVDKLKIIEFEE